MSGNMINYEVINLAPVSEADVLLSLVEERKAELEEQKQKGNLKQGKDKEGKEI